MAAATTTTPDTVLIVKNKPQQATSILYTHAAEERNDSCLCEAGRDVLMQRCRDIRRGGKDELRRDTRQKRSHRHAVLRIRQSSPPLSRL